MVAEACAAVVLAAVAVLASATQAAAPAAAPVGASVFVCTAIRAHVVKKYLGF